MNIKICKENKQLVNRTKLSKKQKDTIFAIVSLLPALAILSIVMFVPIVKGIWMSFYDYTLATMHNPTWNNFENYTRLFKHKDILVYFKNTIIFVFWTVIVQFIIAMVIALLLNSKIKQKNAIRGLFLIPWTIPSVVAALLFTWMFQPQYGIINYIFYNLGLINKANLQWTQSPKLAMVSIVIVCIWRQAPYMIVMILAGLQSVSKSLKEASRIDGANEISVFRYVIIPSIKPVIGTTLIIAIINNFQMFTIIYNMTAGGPIEKTTTLSIAAYSKAFLEYDLGTGSAIGVIWLILLSIISITYTRYTQKLD